MSTQITTPTAATLSPEEAQKRAEEAFELDRRVKAGLRAGRESLWDVAQALSEFDEASGYTALGYEKLGDWLADPEVGMTRRTYYRLVSTYRELERREIPSSTMKQLEVSKVDIVLGAVKAGRVTTEEALADAQELGSRDLREKYIRKPDPAESAPDGPRANAGTNEAAVGTPVHVPNGYYDAPENDGSEAPVRASEVPAHNSPEVASGQDHDDEDVIDATAVELHAIPQDVLEAFGYTLDAVEEMLALSQREVEQRTGKNYRQALRETLEGLLQAGRELIA